MLRFYCVWDDRGALYGDRRAYRLHCFPDGGMEILETRDANSGRDPFPVFLRRGLLPKARHVCLPQRRRLRLLEILAAACR